MKVKATQLGFYGTRRRREGDVFEIDFEKHFSERWMERVRDDKKAPVKKAPAKKDGAE